jgi:hypothetical protein
MGLGLLASMATIPKYINFTSPEQSSNYPWIAAKFFFWIGFEIYVGVIAASIPALRSVMESFLKKLGFELTDQQFKDAHEFHIFSRSKHDHGRNQTIEEGPENDMQRDIEIGNRLNRLNGLANDEDHFIPIVAADTESSIESDEKPWP